MNYKNYIKYFLIAAIFYFNNAAAQLSQGGSPLSIGEKYINKTIDGIKLSAPDISDYLREDSIASAMGDKTMRFGAIIPVELSPNNFGTWENLPDGGRLWRINIQAAGAFSLHLNFSKFFLPEGGKIFAFNKDASIVLGAFTNMNHNADGNFAFMPVAGEELFLELYEPAGRVGESELMIESVVYAYRDFYGMLKNFGSSGACNINVNCPLGDDWQQQKRSICMLLTANNSRFCSGALVNNTAQDGKPYILTARHCQVGTNNIFMFNYESPSCANINGPTNFTIQGCVIRAQLTASDMALVELNSVPPPSYDVFYSGWSRETTPPEFSVGIHHPSGDIKKICLDEQAATNANYGFPSAQCWRVGNWEQGTTEGGSSGSPLFDQNKRIIGQLYGGTASCSSPNEPDFYGRFDISWNTGSQASSRLRDWLDPDNSNITTLNGLGENVVINSFDLRLVNVVNPTGNYCNENSITPELTIRNNGSETITSFIVEYNVNGGALQNYQWSGSLSSQSNIAIQLPALVITEGENQIFSVELLAPNGQNDENPANNSGSSQFSLKNGFPYTLQLTTDNYASETSWRLVDMLNNNQILYNAAQGSLANATTYSELFCLSRGCYRFTIIDSWGDGICCGNNGNGSYILTNPQGETIVQGGQFTFQENTEFCADTTLSNQNLIDEVINLSIYPNPSNGQYFIRFNHSKPKQSTVEIMDLSGRLLKSFIINQTINELDLSAYDNGVYIVRISNTVQQQSYKLIKNH
jgi:hypothetical protein